MNNLFNGLSAVQKAIVNSSYNAHRTKIVNSNYTVTNENSILLVDTSNEVTLTLPSPQLGLEITIKDTTGKASISNITINPGSGVTIDGNENMRIYVNYTTLVLLSTEDSWITLYNITTRSTQASVTVDKNSFHFEL